ncbi:major facilitator superfamily domain-containing protein [Dipodascopsis tothii]|uniref:major facilitator superfamily domain-containing protein n=1 Tax=Dipodascopsis tothii TaxID=44089 RepID=UPI0034CE0F1C
MASLIADELDDEQMLLSGADASPPRGFAPYRDQPGAPATSLLGGEAHGRATTRPSSFVATGESATEIALPWWRRPSVFILLPFFSLLTIAQAGLIAPQVSLMLRLVCRYYYAENGGTAEGVSPAIGLLAEVDRSCQTAEVHNATSKVQLVVQLLSALMAAIVCPKLGLLSDRIGRTAVLAIGSSGTMLSQVLALVAAKSARAGAYRLLYPAAVVEGLTGSHTVQMAMVMSYASDCTAPENRASVFGVLHGAMFLGIAVGPALGGLVVRFTGDLINMYYCSITMQVLSIVAMFTIVPESLSAQRQLNAREVHRLSRQFDPHTPRRSLSGRVYSALNIVEPLRVLWPNDGTKLSVKKNILLLSLMDVTFVCTAMGAMLVIMLYSELRFGWTSVETGFFLSVLGSSRVVILLGILPLAVRFLKWRYPQLAVASGATYIDVILIRFALVAEFFGYCLFGMATTGSQFTAGGALSAFGGIAGPMMQSTLTKHVSRDSIGALLGATGLLQSLARIVAPTIFNLVYAVTVGWRPNTVMYVAAGVYVTLFVFSFRINSDIHGGLYDVSADDVDHEPLRDPAAYTDEVELDVTGVRR